MPARAPVERRRASFFLALLVPLVVACAGVPEREADAPQVGEPDTDGDWVPDGGDACPKDPGPRRRRRELNGCPGTLDDAEFDEIQISFEKSSAKMAPEVERALEKRVAYLEEHPTLLVIVVGYEEKGETSGIARARAQALVDYFVARGIAAERFEPRAETATPRPEATASHRKYYRRVDLHVSTEEAPTQALP